jgi:AraC-like DNA-binding protein
MYRTVPLHPALAPYISEILIQEPDTNETSPDVYRVFPAPFPVMGFQYQGHLDVIQNDEAVTLSQTGITGLQTSVREFFPQQMTRSVLIKFFPYSLFSLLQNPIHEIANQHLGLDYFLKPGKLRVFEEQVNETNGVDQLNALTQDFLIDQIQKTKFEMNGVIVAAAQQILATHGRVRIEAIAQELYMSRRQIERLFHFYVGMSPKDFASLVRFDWSLGHLRNYRSRSELALAAGYADQAHLSRHFMRYAGLSPNQFRKIDQQ